MDGFQLCQVIHSDPELMTLPIILQSSSYQTKKDRDFGLDVGADAFIPKGASALDLAVLINQIIAQKQQQPANVEEGLEEDEFQRLHRQRMLFRLLEETSALEHANSALEREKNTAQRYLDIAGVVLLVLDRQMKVSLINKKGCQLLGYSAEEIVGKKWAEHFVPSHKQNEIQSIFDQLLRGHNEPFETVENPILTRNGEERYIIWHNTLLRDEDGNIIATLSSGEDITQRKQAEASLRESEEKYRLLFENVPDGVYRTTPDGRYLDANPALIRMLGYDSLKDLKETFAYDHYCYPEERQRFLERITREGQISNYELCMRRKDGQQIIGLENALAVRDAAGEILYLEGTLSDITALIETERALEEKAALLQALSAIDREIITSSEIGPVLELAARTTAEFLRLPKIAIAVYDQNEQLKIAASYGFEDMASEAPRIIQFLDNARQTLACSETDCILSEQTSVTETIERAEPCDCVLVPLRAQQKRLIGVMAAFDGVENEWRPDELQTLQQLAGEVALALEHARMEEAQARQIERLSKLQKISADLAGLHTQSEVLDAVISNISSLIDIHYAGIGMFENETREAVLVAQTDLSDSTPLGIHIPMHLPILAPLIVPGEPLIIRNIQEDAPELLPLLLHSQNRALAIYPMRQNEKTLGFICTNRFTPFAPDEDEINIMKLLAERAAAALENARLFEETNRNLRRINSLREIDKAITGSFDLNPILNIILREILSHLGVHAAQVLLYDPAFQRLKFAAGVGFKTLAARSASLKPAEGYAGQAVLERRTICIANLAEDELGRLSRYDVLAKEGFAALASVPLIAKGQIKGVLEVFHREPLKISKDWLDFLEALAGQAAIAIDDVQLFEGMQRSNFELAMAYDATIEGWSNALELRDMETEGHSQRVTEMTVRLADAMGIKPEMLIHVRRGALLHDIGKMGIPDSILFKPGKLTEEEWEIMRQHPVYAFKMLSRVTFLHPALDIPHYHHERWNGSGYPDGLSGTQIPLAARVFAVVDVWDALSSDRPYREAWPQEKVLAYLDEQAGIQFDPAVTAKFIEMMQQENGR
jgi:PAS domain S-box-containing protein